MYVNFERLLSSGMTAQELLYLLAVRQKEKMIVETIPSETIEMFRINGWIEGEKTMKLTKKGTALLDQIETAGLTSEISLLLNDLTELYKSYGKDIGISVKEAESRLIWFISETNFRPGVIRDTVLTYLEDNPEYTLSLCNLIWKPQSAAFSVHKKLRESKLFDLIAQKFGFKTDPYFEDKKTVEYAWLFAVSRLPNPPAKSELNVYFTGSSKEDKERIKDIKSKLAIYLRNYKE